MIGTRTRRWTRSGALALIASLSWSGAAMEPLPSSGSASRAERWLYNPRERTEAAHEAKDTGDEEILVERLETARRLAPDDPTVLYNAATGRLIADTDTEGAAALLERAADLAPPGLAPHALYNLGNARLAGDRPAAAIEAYRHALQLAPDLRPAKHNLEIALARLQRKRTEGTDRTPEEPDEEADAREAGSGRDRSGEEGERGSGSGAAGAAGPGPATPPLRRFEEQPDMTAAQATALLAAIEDLERRQRVQEASERAKRARGAGGKDW